MPRGVGKPWQPGQSGNPSGKPRGARNKSSQIVEKLMQGELEDVARAVITAAKGGDMMAARIVIAQVAPAPKDRTIMLERIPDLTDAVGCAEAQTAIITEVAQGNLTPSEGSVLSGIIENRRRAVETMELMRRVEAIERANNDKT